MSASAPRPSKALMEIAYKILKTPQQLRQTYKPSPKEVNAWRQRLYRETAGKQ